MQAVLSVIAIIDTPTPERWVNQLITRLEARDRVQLTLVVQESDEQSAKSLASAPEPAGASMARVSDTVSTSGSTRWPGRLATKLLNEQIDKPLLSDDPWLRESMASAESTELLSARNCRPSLDAASIVLKLTRSPLPEDLWPPTSVPVWDAHVETLDARIEDALLQQEPLTWVHLWSHQRANDSREILTRRIASHALPRQSFSLTDLSRAAWFSLPSVIDARVNWLAQGCDPVSTEYTDSPPLAEHVIDPEVRAAHDRAETLQHHEYLPAAISGTRRLGLALSLWWYHSVERIRHRFWYEQWQLAFRNDGPDALFQPAPEIQSGDSLENSNQLNALANGSVGDFITIDSPDMTWWADPHLHRHGDDLYVFFEEKALDADNGHLLAARLTDDGRLEDIVNVLEGDQHLSYPFVFSDDNDTYMIPENASHRSVPLYKAQRFPDQWVKVQDVLSDVNLAASTVHFDGELWWMFTNGMSHPSVNARDELHLYHAQHVTGPWHAHPMNPVITGVDRARMAGSIIRDGRGLYRPSQFGARRYGYGINLHRIDRLDTQGYAETTVGRLLPEEGSQWLGCHSTSYLDGVTLVDRIVQRRRRS